ncbi:MAG: NADH-quinone oxidoreductase subunit C [Deltaproteobacteria bacterium]|nr:NADH-quinone oxidoreductase subunit C [Deltaproteobacteria bacterium]MBI3294102.1 NADH-quinone oxidoreductase subunit C [Deltaproteobacteria bacterium]
MKTADIFPQLKALLPTSVLELSETKPDSFIKIEGTAIREIATLLRDRFGFETLSCISGTDHPTLPALSVTYHFASYQHKSIVALKAFVPRQDNVYLPSLVSLFTGADWLERETYDMLGIVFTDHPDHRRILMPEDWTGFPLRKDFETPDYYNGMPVPLSFEPGGNA